jgi:hypothetical protein
MATDRAKFFLTIAEFNTKSVSFSPYYVEANITFPTARTVTNYQTICYLLYFDMSGNSRRGKLGATAIYRRTNNVGLKFEGFLSNSVATSMRKIGISLITY